MGSALLGEDIVAESENILLEGINKLERHLHLDPIHTALKVHRLMNRIFSIV